MVIIREDKTKPQITKSDLERAVFGDPAKGDEAFITIDGKDFVKTGAKQWQSYSDNPYAHPRNYTTDAIWAAVQKAKRVELIEKFSEEEMKAIRKITVYEAQGSDSLGTAPEGAAQLVMLSPSDPRYKALH